MTKVKAAKGAAVKTIAHILAARKGGIVSVAPGDSVRQALQTMADSDIGAVLVMEGGHLLGILSERDYARKIILKGRMSEDTEIREVMSDKVICVGLGTTLDEAMAIMSERKIRHLPAVDADNEVVGVISMRDLVKEIISEQSFVIAQLERYIAS